MDDPVTVTPDGGPPIDAPSGWKRVGSVVLRVGITVVALGLSALLLTSLFEELDWATVRSALGSLTDAERIALVSGAGLAIAAQGLITSSTVKGLPVRRGVLAFLAPAAVASIVPGPSDLPLRYRMLGSWGYTPAERGLAVTASGIFSIGSKLVMPVLAAIAALIGGVALGEGVGRTIVIAGVVLAVLIVATSVVLGSPRLTAGLAHWLQAPWDVVTRWLKRDSGPLPAVLQEARSQATDLLRDRWPVALWAVFLYTVAQVGLMVMAIRFVGVPDDALGITGVFVAYGIVQGLTALPITAGNVGVAEAGWVGLLGAMAGTEFINEVTAAVIIFRVLTWLAIIPLGLAALLIWRRTTRGTVDDDEPARSRPRP